jgi:nucleotide-binding universal stress UspA family protein
MKILVAVDDSPYSEQMLDAVISRHWPEETQFKVLTVIEPVGKKYVRAIEAEQGQSLQEIDHMRRENAVGICDKIRHSIEAAVKGAIVHYEVRNGRPEEQILEAAAEWNAERIIVGAHGHTVCPHNLPGSVSRGIAANARCHVEVVKPSSEYRNRLTAKAV